MTDLRIAGKYQLHYRIGRGAFGELYRGVNLATGEDVAIKLEPIDAKPPQLLYESKLYKILVGGVGIPYIYHYAPEENTMYWSWICWVPPWRISSQLAIGTFHSKLCSC